MSTHPIDIVIPWVDGSDPVWQADHAKYRASKSADNHPARYREWGLFRYWFRGIEQNAPWVRKVHLLTYGHLPAWLDPDHPKLHIVNHRDFIPEEYLPTFSSHTIELNMHRIPDLAEHFLYFNDDVYLMKPSQPEDFFRDGLPRDTAVMGVIKNNDTANFMPYIMLNMMALVNMSFDKRSVIRQNFGKWFYPGYGKGLLYNLYLLPWGDFTGFRNYHSCVSFCKSTLEEVWDRFPEVLDATCRHKFRDRGDVNQYLFRYWQLASGRFAPKKPDSTYLTIGKQSESEVERLLRGGKYRVVCVNDDPMDFDFDTERQQLVDIFQRTFPQTSAFERS